ncbi:ABC transporter permease [Hymenobacter rubripertinctus]|uniref:FtsX-like permease family protein n=1 Tax=Hymenobacter rubripertinctus TaxID=2029981 RepID=A0A418QX68_9BACT|nr:ABC transporter permease [Hymenobacter rubripertinctus]RIY09751.1 FtsX-like permease family protein [Hymenobacter rubripertinctus]
MIRHLITLMWNRRRANALLLAEIFLAFVVLFVVGSVGLFNWRNYQEPMGFSYDNVWVIDLDAGTQPRADQFATLQTVLRQLRSAPGVVSVSRTASNTPFSGSNNTTWMETEKDGIKQSVEDVNYYEANIELREVMGVQMREGRWFDHRDETATRTPVVITQLLRDKLFGPGAPAVGKRINNREAEWQVVGVSGAYRADGELQEPRPAMFVYLSPDDTTRARNTLLVKVRPGSGAALEKKISADIRSAGTTWSSNVRALAEQRLTQFKFGLVLPVILGVVCLFLIINVALGLFGVLWLNISRRRGEIGVRRAMGATAGNISGQVLGEILVLTTFGLVLGLLVAVQFPLLGIFSVLPSIYFTAMLLAAGVLYLLAVVCALYPSRLAAGIQPAVALREE